MATSIQPPIGELTPFHLCMRLTTHAEQRPTIIFCGITYADEPLGWAREDYIQPEAHFDRNGNEIPRHAWVYASALFTLAPYTRSMKITVRCWDDKVSDTRLSIIVADEYKHVAEDAMRRDIAHFVDAKLQGSPGQQKQLTHGMLDVRSDVELRDPVTGRHILWTLLQWKAHNTRAYPAGMRMQEEEEEILKEVRRERQQSTGCLDFGHVEEGNRERVELHAGLDLVEVESEVKGESEGVEREREEEAVDVTAVKMRYLEGREAYELDQIFDRFFD